MKLTRKVKSILDNYSADSPGVKANLPRILMQVCRPMPRRLA